MLLHGCKDLQTKKVEIAVAGVSCQIKNHLLVGLMEYAGRMEKFNRGMNSMRIEKRSLVDGTCNFCNRSKVSKTGVGLEYPYNIVTNVEGNNSSVRFCDDCLKELLQKTSVID